MATPSIVIVGGGPAGLAALRSLAHNGLAATLLERSDTLGGMLRWADHPFVDALGFELASGHAVAERLVGALAPTPISGDPRRLAVRVVGGAESVIALGVEVRAIARAAATRGRWGVHTRDDGPRDDGPRDDGPRAVDAVVVASGTRARTLGLDGEHALGLHDRARDLGARLVDAPVVVIGGGDEAVTTAHALAEAGAHVTLLARGPLRARPQFADPLAAHPRATLIVGDRAARLITDARGALSAIETAAGRLLPAARAFVRVGVEPALPHVEPAPDTHGDGRWVVDAFGRTSLAGLYAIGDACVEPARRYLLQAMASGTLAARAIEVDRAAAR